MYFITNRALTVSWRSRRGRKIDFDLRNTEAQRSLFFCRRDGEGDYTEILSSGLLEELRAHACREILLYIHGFNTLPEQAFAHVSTMQGMLDDALPGRVLVVPLVWPCDNDFGVVKDYWDDQRAADASAYGFARALGKFLTWQEEQPAEEKCIKRINLLAHSMGNRVLRESLRVWVKYQRAWDPPMIFRNVFMAAADVVNESLQETHSGRHIPPAARNVVVYHASDDLALRSSKIANATQASRRLGHTGPYDMTRVPRNVYAVDCDDFNVSYDRPLGHTYFMRASDGSPGVLFEHLVACIETGRVALDGASLVRQGRL